MPATDSYTRDIKKVHIVFALGSIALFAVTIWMMAADHAREWTGYQRHFEDIQSQKLIAANESLEKSPKYEATREELLEQQKNAQRQLDSVRPEVNRVTGELAEAERLFDLAGRAVRAGRAQRDKARADYDLAVRDGVSGDKLNAYQQSFDDKQRRVDKLEIEVQERQVARDRAQNELKDLTKSRDDATAAIAKLNSDIDLRDKALAKLDPQGFSAFKKTIMEWPIINGFNSPLKITQDWLPNLSIQLGMARTARFDRCRTCHGGIDRVESGNVPTFPFGDPHGNSISEWVLQNRFPQPYSTHTHPDLYLTSASPHPLQKFGCTICHDGQGSGTSFKDASHTANDPHQYAVWHEKHHYNSNHFWEYPMQPERLRESTCIKCHHSVVELGIHPKFGASAPKLFKGYNLVKEFGCFGCHEIQGFDGTRPIGPDLRLEPSTEAEAAKIAADPTQFAGTMRKVGPSLRHIRTKTSPQFVAYWVEDPQRFRPTTRMPRFFHTSNLEDATGKQMQPIELAGIAHYLFAKSEPLDLMEPEAGYAPNASRGKELFSKRGCLACHSHEAFHDSHADFGPDLSRVHAKIRPGQDGAKWVYTWIRDPQRYHKRTRMPNLFIEPYSEAGKQIDPAADIAAFLLEKGPEKFPVPKVDDKALDDLVKLFVSKALKADEVSALLETAPHTYPLPKSQVKADLKAWEQRGNPSGADAYPVAKSLVKGDEAELIADDGKPVSDPQKWYGMRLNYIGRRTISRYGCYGCHDIANFETARPIGTTLQDWGRKDTSRLAPEHIEEYLMEHKEAGGMTMHDRVVDAMKRARAGGTGTGEFKGDEEEREMRAAYFYNDLTHHGRAGFLWQKLRDPRSYDYLKTETKGYDERLRMPKFPFNEEQIEAIATFVLGLVADPPGKDYVYHPDGAAKARNEGERLIDRYNCTGCHMLDMPEIRYGVDPKEITASEPQASDQPAARDLLLRLKPPERGLTGNTMLVKMPKSEKTVPIVRFHGLIFARPDPADPPEDQEYAFDLWSTLDVAGKTLFPASRVLVKRTQLVPEATPHDGYAAPARGGTFAEWLVERILATTPDANRQLAWQMAPPPLYKEGTKVQTSWLYQFLRDPYRLRQTTVLRMPRFNMSAEEAQTLANYFAAVDNEPFPYQKIAPRDPDYLAAREASLGKYLEPRKEHYLTDSWRVFNGGSCINCHSLAGRQVKVGDPKKDIRGPNLEYASDRLRPDWLMLWLYNPRWITPYTSMPQVFPKNQAATGELSKIFGGDTGLQAIATRDALMNYHRLMEQEGKSVAEAAPVNPSEQPPPHTGQQGRTSALDKRPSVGGSE